MTQHHPIPSYPQGWAKKPPPGIYLEGELLASAAFAELNQTEMRVFLRFYQKRQIAKKRRGEVLNNGKITFPYDEAEEMGISSTAYTRALDGLLARGFIDITYSGEGMYRSKSLYAISTRWKHFGTERFEKKERRLRLRKKVGFLKGHGKS